MYYFGIANKIDGFMGSTAGNIFIYLQWVLQSGWRIRHVHIYPMGVRYACSL